MNTQTKQKLPRIGDKKWIWKTKHDKEVGEVIVVSGGRRFMVAGKDVRARQREAGMQGEKLLEVGIYDLVEEGTGQTMSVRFEYEIEEIKDEWSN